MEGSVKGPRKDAFSVLLAALCRLVGINAVTAERLHAGTIKPSEAEEP